MTPEDADAAKLAKLLSSMQLTATVGGDGKTLSVTIPPTRADIIHAYVSELLL